MGKDGNDQHLVYRGRGDTPAARGGTWAPAWSPDGTKIAFLCYVENPTGRLPLLDVRFVDVASREVTSLHMRVGTDLNGPQWVTNGTLLVNRYD
jgi:Tol biopolymer transport system component